MKYNILLLLSLFLFNTDVSGQLSGTVYDTSGAPLSFVTVYKQGTSKGTVSNLDGGYNLVLDEGPHVIVFKYVGYRDVIKKVNVKGEVQLDVTLEEDEIVIDEIEISADAEDPAYRVIRAAIKARESNKVQIEKFEADLYVKGVVKMIKAPEKILGAEIGDMGGMLDSTGQGIVYLGESQSTLYFQEPDNYKEVMYSSIVAEDDGQFNFNRFENSRITPYEEYFEFNRTLIMPLADNALSHYRYKLVEAKVDEEGRLINMIKVIPKSEIKPSLFGYLYIIEDSWKVTELDLSFTGKSIKQPVFDTIRIRQIHLPLVDDKWLLFTQTMDFKMGVFGFEIGGGFTYVFNDYQLEPTFPDDLFGAETFTLNEDAVKTDSSFWTSVRPIKLTEEERDNYIRKDSLKRLWASKEYKDSVDQKNNKFVLGDLLFGYSWADSYNNTYISASSPLSVVGFNAIEGLSLGSGFRFTKLDSTEERRFSFESNIRYGFADKRFKNETTITYRKSNKFWERYSLYLGDSYRQYDENNPVLNINSLTDALFDKEHSKKMFKKQYIGLGYRRELFNGVYLNSSLIYARRSPLEVLSDYSWGNREAEYNTNHPTNDNLSGNFFEPHNSMNLALHMRFRIGQKYASYPKFRIRQTSSWPDIWLRYNKGISVGDTDFDKLRIQIRDSYVNYKLLGFGSYNIEMGTFLTQDKVEFIDLHHFLGNEHLLAYRSRYLRGYKLLPLYENSTTEDYLSVFYEHSLDGYLLDRIPLFNKLGWDLVVGGNVLARRNQDPYYEASVGIKNIKIGAFSLFRLDFAWSYDNNGLLDRGFIIGLSNLFEE